MREADEPEGELVVEWTPIPNRRIWARLYAEGPRYRLWVEGYGTNDTDARRVAGYLVEVQTELGKQVAAEQWLSRTGQVPERETP